MITVGAKEFRLRLKYYLDQLEKGEEITLIRNSLVIAHLVPSEQAKAKRRPSQPAARPRTGAAENNDNQPVTFRRFGLQEDAAPIRQLHREALESVGGYIEPDPDDHGAVRVNHDLAGPGAYYESLGGEFWVAEKDGLIVAMGGFKMHVAGEPGEAELKRLHVKPAYQGQGISEELLEILEERVRQNGFQVLVFDETSKKQL